MGLLFLSLLASNLYVGGFNRFEVWRFADAYTWIFERAHVDLDADPWSVMLEWTYDHPDSNASFEAKNRLYRYQLTYALPSLELRLGTFETTLGRGFLLYSGEDEVALLDRFLQGVSISYWGSSIQTQGFIGRPESYLFYERTNPIDDVLYGGSLEWVPARVLSRLGVEGMGWATRNPLSREYEHTAFAGAYVELQPDAYYVYAEGVFRKGYDPQVFADTFGWALYGQWGYRGAGMSWQVEASRGSLFGHPYMLPPALDHYGVYLNGGRDETGVAIEGNGKVRGGWVWTLHASRLWGSFAGQPGKIVEGFAKLQKRWGPVEMTTSLDGIQFKNAIAAGIFDRREWTLSLHFVGRITRQIGWDFKYQPRKRNTGPQTYTDHDVTLGFSQFPWVDLAWTLQKRVGDSTGTWMRVDLFVHLGNRAEWEITVGSQRKDLVCSGGVCRYEPEFKGVRTRLLVRF